jgi:hypothetical protein
MNHMDFKTAEKWAVSAAVVEQARALDYRIAGGDAYPPKNYDRPPHDGCSSTTIEQCALWQVSAEPAVPKRAFLVSLTQQNGNWFVSEIAQRR